VAILYVSHRLDEIVAIADRCTVMRDGKVVAEFARGEFSADELAREMTGRDIEKEHAPSDVAPGEELLEATHAGEMRLHAREVIGVAGLLGSGTTDFLRKLFGAEGGTRTRRRGREVAVHHPADAIAAGTGMVPNERALGLVLDLTVRDNIVLPNLALFGAWWRMDDAAAERVVRELNHRHSVERSGQVTQPVIVHASRREEERQRVDQDLKKGPDPDSRARCRAAPSPPEPSQHRQRSGSPGEMQDERDGHRF
jgi:ABC-type sugar transport system ATPase subunit